MSRRRNTDELEISAVRLVLNPPHVTAIGFVKSLQCENLHVGIPDHFAPLGVADANRLNVNRGASMQPFDGELGVCQVAHFLSTSMTNWATTSAVDAATSSR